MFVNGGYVTVNDVPDASARLPGMCYFRCKNILIHWRTSALFLPMLTHLGFTIVASDTLSTFGRLAKSVLWRCLSWIKWFSVQPCAVTRQLIHIQKPWTEHGWSMPGVQSPQMPITLGFNSPFNSRLKCQTNVTWGGGVITLRICWWQQYLMSRNSFYQQIHYVDTRQRQRCLLSH